MEKLARPSGGGARLGTLDMQSYLEVMGRQLAEIEAQHHEFFASRPDRLGRVRNQEQGQGKSCSSESNSVCKQSGGYVSPGDRHARADGDTLAGHLQQSPPSVGSSGAVSGPTGSSSSSQGGARRSLHFTDDASSSRGSGMTAGDGARNPQGIGEVERQVLKAGSAARTGPQQHPRAEHPVASQARSRLAKHAVLGTPDSGPSTSASHSISPSTASRRASASNPATPSTSSAQTGGGASAGAGASVTSDNSSRNGHYAVYDVSGVASISYSTPRTQDCDDPVTASASAASKEQRRASRAGGGVVSPSPGPHLAGLQGSCEASPSAPSVDSSALAVHGRQMDTEEGSVSGGDDLPADLSLAGQAFDGIDSEEDDEELEQQQQQRRHASTPASSNVTTSSVLTRGANGGGQVAEPSGKRAQAPHPLDAAAASAAYGSRPQSRGAPRMPLVVASLETEEALRALLATPRLTSAAGAPVDASIDVEGLEVPDDVLAALAKTDGMDLDAALGAAMAASLREQHAAGPMDKAGGVASRGEGQAPSAVHGRHPAIGPGALTAAPPTVTTRGFDISLRSAGNATGRSAGTAGATTATGMALPASRFTHPQHDEVNPAVRLDASLEVGNVDVLSRTMEISFDAVGVSPGVQGEGVRDSVAVAAAAIEAQRAAAQQHPQPVLYSLLPRSPGVTGGAAAAEEDGRRLTADGGGRRRSNTGDGSGGSRRSNTGDGPGSGKRSMADEGSSTRSTGDGSGLLTEGVGPSSHLHPAAARPGASTAPLPLEGESPCRAAPGSAGPVASPSTGSPAVRHGLDGDMVLYGSPNQRSGPGVGGDGAGASGQTPSTDLGQLTLTSPGGTHAGSRLKRNSRNAIEDIGLGSTPDGGAEGGAGASAEELFAPVPSASGAEAALRPRSIVGGSSRRQLAGSGASSGANSINFDMSLTQAAAAAASGSGRTPGVSAVSSPTASARHMRVPAPGPLQVPTTPHQPPAPHQQQQEGALHHPVFSTFSVAVLSPSAAQVASYDLSVDEAGQPYSPPSNAATTLPTDQSVSSSRIGRAGQAQQAAAAGPPLAAFSRAAALAAAADVGLAVPSAGTDCRHRHASTAAAAAGLEPGRSAVDADEALLGQQSAVGASGTGPPPTHACRGVSGAESQAAGDSHASLLQEAGQSPGPASVAASAAKLTQLKARRQQQWQSQHGLLGHTAAEGPDASTAPDLPAPSGQQQQPQFTPLRNAHRDADPEQANNLASSALGAAAADHDRTAVTPGHPGAGTFRGPEPSDSVAVPSAPSAAAIAAASSPLLPEAVAEAIARATGGQLAASRGELNLGHGITGLSVAIEAGQVKWAWQTDVKGKTADKLPEDPYAEGGARSPGGADSSDSSLRGSPTGEHGGVRDSGSDWALQHLPPPQWQRHGQLPASGRQKEAAAHGLQKAAAVSHGGLRHQAEQEVPFPEGGKAQYAAMRRHSEYSVLADRPAATAVAGPQSAGGASVSGPPGFRVASASDAGAQGSKALALLRLKQQSIMRHNVCLPEHKEPEPQPVRQRREIQQPAPTSPQQLPQNGRSRAASADCRTAVARPQRRASAPRVPESIAEYGDGGRHGARAGVAELADGEATGGGDVASGPQVQPKAFLRRRSSKVQARKVDWSYVKPRTNSRNPDYVVGNNSPDVVLKTRMSPLTSPKGGVAKPPIGVNAGARAKKPATKLQLSPSEEDRASAAPLMAAARRRTNSNIPAAPGPTAGPTAGVSAAGDKRAGVVARHPARGNGLSPLDDLLAHVNTLLKDFDKVVM